MTGADDAVVSSSDVTQCAVSVKNPGGVLSWCMLKFSADSTLYFKHVTMEEKGAPFIISDPEA